MAKSKVDDTKSQTKNDALRTTKNASCEMPEGKRKHYKKEMCEERRSSTFSLILCFALCKVLIVVLPQKPSNMFYKLFYG